MMTKEEYKKNLVRMFDSIRVECKGKDSCAGVDCNNCPFYERVCNVTRLRPYEVIEVIERWTDEHPIITNAMKFKEVFGTEVLKDACVNGDKQCKECEYFNGDSCDVRKRFWYEEYKPTKEGEE